MTNSSENCIEICNGLLRGERSAVETYRKAIEKHGDKPEVQELRRILGEHQQMVSKLEENVRSMGGTPDTDSGAWGTFANAVQSTANLFGANSAVESLIQGEKHGLSDYEDAVENEYTMPDCANMFRTDCIPATRRHIASLERIQEAV